jgi:V/A-type H+-transporting ATPase subunit I
MSLRPASALWFELLTSREELGAVLDALSRTGSVQLEARSRGGDHLAMSGLAAVLDGYSVLARRYLPWWPAPVLRPPGPDEAIGDRPRTALGRLQQWARAAEPVVTELEAVARERHDLERLERVVLAADPAVPRRGLLAAAGPTHHARIYRLPAGLGELALPASALAQRLLGELEDHLIVVGLAGELDELDAALTLHRAQRVPVPSGLPAATAELGAELARRRAALDPREHDARARLVALDVQHGVAEARGLLVIAAWLLAHVPELAVTEHFAWVTGWCADPDDCRVREALEARGLHFLLLALPAPADAVPPSVLHNPRWARPFEVFTRLMGMPGRGEADPSSVVALLAPLMFGFMFGDVVQGGIVALAGAVLGRRIPSLRLLLPGGLVAMIFGFAFGSVFAREDVLPALWLHPLAAPLTILAVALGFGIVVIVLGQLLDALQYFWRGELHHWLARDAGVLLAYLGLVFAFLEPRALWAAPLGVAWMLAGSSWLAVDRLRALGAAVGELLERLLQLLVNSVSFVRVGAFALAHAGLCVAVVGIAEAAGPAYWPVLVIGNAAIIAIEGLVVGIQTTRLILFEFFIRFLAAKGRRFEPLPPPAPFPITLPGHQS